MDRPAPEVQEVEVDTDTEEFRNLRDTLASDPEAAQALAKRILGSKIAGDIVSSGDSQDALEKVRQWIQANPVSAAHLAVGFAKDDATGTHEFEDSLFTRVQRRFQLNQQYEGLLDRLHETALESEHLTQKGLDEDEARQGLKRLFEGQDKASGRLVPPKPEGAEQEHAAGESGLTQAVGASYDKLRSDKVKSAQVLAYQREMNRFRPPGAPRLVETGRLDFDTLRYPFYALRFDIDRLKFYLKVRPLTREAGAQERAQGALDLAEKALGEFVAAAQQTKGRDRVMPQLLRTLAAKRQEAARWITVAMLERQIDLLLGQRNFMTDRLKTAIGRAPLDEQTRRLYLNRGGELGRSMDAVTQDARRALGQLKEGSYASRLDQTDRLVQAVRKGAYRLSEYLRRYVETPLRLMSLRRASGTWQEWARPWVLRFFPGSDYAGKLRRQQQMDQALRAYFTRIAATPPASLL